MRKKNIFNNVIRLRKSKYNKPFTYQIIAILNKKKTSSQDVIERFGFINKSTININAINYKILAFYLNKGYILNNNIKFFIYNILK